MNIQWNTFTKYRDGFNDKIYYNDKRGEVLQELLEKFPHYQVIGAQQVADWVGSSTRKLNANKVWKLFPQYGLICLVQKIDHETQSNRLLVHPLFRWLEQWEGTPLLEPSAEDSIKELGPTQKQLTELQAREATELLSYVIARLDDSEVPDPKEATLWAKVAAGEGVRADQPEASVAMEKLNGEDFGEHPSYDGLAISGTLGGSGFEIIDRKEAERLARSKIYLFALAGCYNLRAAASTDSTDKNYKPSPVSKDSSLSSSDDDMAEPGNRQPKGPYLIHKEELITESEPPTFSFDEETNTLSFDFQLGPLWTRYTEEQ